MISSIWIRQARLSSPGTQGILRTTIASIRCPASRIRAHELSSQLARRASSSSPKPRPKAAEPAAKPQGFHAPRLIIYHAGTPRIFVLGALKISAIFVLGFFAVVTIPSYVQAGAPWWQTAGLVAAGTVPFLAIWYLTSPMVMWVHLRVPKGLQRSQQAVERFIRNVPADTEVTITTMGAIGRPRVSQVRLGDLRHERRRLGLVNYVRDVRRENAARKWYHFPAVGQFKIENRVFADKRSRRPWMWYTVVQGFRERQRREQQAAAARERRV